MPSSVRRLVRALLLVVAVVGLSRVLATTGHFGDGAALLLFVFGGVGLLVVLASRVK